MLRHQGARGHEVDAHMPGSGSRLCAFLALMLLAGTPAVAGVTGRAAVPMIDEFSGMMADLAGGQGLRDRAGRGEGGPEVVAGSGGGAAAMRKLDRAEALAALDRILAARMAMLDHAERMIERAAAMPSSGTLESVRAAIAAALEANNAALDAVLTAVDDLEIPLETRRMVRRLMAGVEARQEQIEEVMDKLDSDPDACSEDKDTAAH